MVGVIALIVFGPQKLPEIARTVGNFLNQLKAMANEVRTEFSAGLDDTDEPVADEVTVEAPDEVTVEAPEDGDPTEPTSDESAQ